MPLTTDTTSATNVAEATRRLYLGLYPDASDQPVRRLFAEADRLFSRSLTGALTPQAMVGRARLCYQRRMYADAMELAKKARAEYPSYADARLVLADVLEKMGKPSEAEVIRSEAQDLGP